MPTPAHVHRLAGVRILIVEDDPDLREAVAEGLAMDGATISSAETGNSGFSAFMREKPDVIVSDLSMPDGTGYDFIKSVRGLPPERGGLTPAIAISSKESMSAALLAGFQVFISKPFELIPLVDAIADLRRAR